MIQRGAVYKKYESKRLIGGHAMRNKLLCGVAAVAIIAATSGSVLAADSRMKAPPAGVLPAVHNWTGWYIGGHIGYGEGKYDGIWDPSEAPPVDFNALRLRGIVGGAHIGYNYQMGGFVLGVEGDITATSWFDSQRHQPSFTAGYTGKIDALASLRLRIGLPLNRILLYATGGIAVAKAKIILDSQEVEQVHHFTKFGGVVGGGVEWAYDSNLILRAEVLHYIFNENTTTPLREGTAADFARFSNATVVRFGASYLFGGPVMAEGYAVKAPPQLRPGWAGPYIGGHIGYGIGRFAGIWDTSEAPPIDFSRFNTSGLVGGMHIGHNWHMGGFVLGVEADITATAWSERRNHEPTFSSQYNGQIDLLASLRARIGLPLGSSMLPYLTGGIALARATVDLRSGDRATDTQQIINFTSIGGVVGAGVEWAYTHNLTFRLEGLHYMFNDSKAINIGGNPGTVTLDNATVIRVGGSYRF